VTHSLFSVLCKARMPRASGNLLRPIFRSSGAGHVPFRDCESRSTPGHMGGRSASTFDPPFALAIIGARPFSLAWCAEKWGRGGRNGELAHGTSTTWPDKKRARAVGGGRPARKGRAHLDCRPSRAPSDDPAKGP